MWPLIMKEVIYSFLSLSKNKIALQFGTSKFTLSDADSKLKNIIKERYFENKIFLEYFTLLVESVNEGILVIFGEAINISNFPYKTIE